MGHSFRVRIILLSVAVSGLVLAVFALSAWAFVQRIALQRIDRELAERMGPIAIVSHPPEHWSWIAGGLDLSYRTNEGGGCLVLVKNVTGEVLHQSTNWPGDLPADRFPTPDPASPRLRSFPPPPAPPAPPKASPEGPGAPKQPAPPGPAWTFLPVAPPVFATRRTASGTWRFCTMENSEVTLVVGVSLARFGAEMARVRNGLLAALPAALLLIALGSWVISRRALRSVEQLAHVAERVTASSLDERIPAEGADTEFRRLITVFNGMLDRLERSFSQASRFSADAAHELRTPLTILQGSIEQALQEAPAGSEQQRVYNNLLEEVQGLKEIVRKLLLLSLADAGKLELHPKPVNLTEAAEGVCEDLEAVAPGLTIKRELEPDVWIEADADLMGQVLRNLATNAVKYNREGGWVEVRLARAESTAVLTVANTGDGIPPADRDRVFERFYRADRSRSRKVDGVGLGLSLAREIARAHGGDLRLEDNSDGVTVFAVTLPLAPAAE
ncbi:MAG: HAMP domain-containing protein [Armatimonadetes bacterium]|nr:HAMP domain-containing protein [Armatimonadota bacterium]